MNNASKDIAIIGMACVLPGAPDKQRYWENILHKVNAIADAPPESLPASLEFTHVAKKRVLFHGIERDLEARPVVSRDAFKRL